MAKNGRQSWQCSYCGVRTGMNVGNRPQPGNCLRKPRTKDGKYKPHTWKKVD